MRIGLYGLPSAGKTHILQKVDFMEVLSGSTLLRSETPDFDSKSEEEKEQARKRLAEKLMKKPEFIMDGHYAFGSTTVFTESDGQLYDAFLYLYLDPELLRRRMAASQKNAKYLFCDIEKWQVNEIESLREYCHLHQKDFYVLDAPPDNIFRDVTEVLAFIRAVKEGFSCRSFAHQCAAKILSGTSSTVVTLLDGDKTLTAEDTSGKLLHYKTHLYDGNFYTGYQAWKQSQDFQKLTCPDFSEPMVPLNDRVLQQVKKPAYILTSGNEKIWSRISEQMQLPFFCGPEMAADTKLFITQELMKAGKKVIAYGDSMNDYYMLRQADEGNLVAKPDGSISRSLRERNLRGLKIV